VLHADLSQRVAIATADMPWSSSADKLLEDAGARLTKLVQLAAGAAVPVVGSAGCLDVLVLAGSVGGHRAGTFLHDAASTRLVADTDCTLFVKQRPAQHVARVAIDTRSFEFPPHAVSHAPLVDGSDGHVVVMHFPPGSAIASHAHDRGEEFFVLDGELIDELGRYPRHAWVRQPPASVHAVRSPNGCTMLTFAHHLG
jgi:hypothetical protein